jgi:hypothetical protein
VKGGTHAYAFYYHVPGTEELYQRVKAEIGDDPPKGQLLHLVVKSDGGLRHLNVWQSKEDWDRHRQERIAPAVAKVLAAAGITERPPAPVEQQLDVVDVWTGA